MRQPTFVRPLNNFREAELQDHVLEKLGERRAKQSPNVFNEERLSVVSPHGPNNFGKEVPSVARPAVLAADGKWLARRPSRDQIDPFEGPKVEISDISFMQRPAVNWVKLPPLVLADRFASVVIPFKYRVMMESSKGRSECEATGPRKELDRFHPRNLLILFASAAAFFTWHSQITITPQPFARNLLAFLPSRTAFASSLVARNPSETWEAWRLDSHHGGANSNHGRI